jgi:hypothetical protein
MQPSLSGQVSDLVGFVNRHFYWGWTVDCGEGCEGMFCTEETAIAFRAQTFIDEDPVDDVMRVREDVEVFPIIFFRGRSHDEQPGHRLTRDEIAMLGPCRHLNDTAAIGAGGWVSGAE